MGWADAFPGVSDEQLMANALRGSAEAFEELYHRYARRIFGFAHRLVRDYQEAESITQEVFLKLLRDSGSYNPSRRFSTWIYAIARNLCLDDLARGRPDPIGDGEQFTSREPAPPAEVDARETQQRLRAAIDGLPLLYREVVQLRVFGRLPYREIAAIVGCPESTARSRMDLAIKRLRAGLCLELAGRENLVDEFSSRP